MTVYLNEPAPDYHAREAFSAGMAQNIVGPDGCLAIAWHRCAWLNPNYVAEHDEALDNGTLAHAAILEPEKLDQIITIINAKNYRTKEAQALRDEAYAQGKVPILFDREPGSTGASFQKIMAMRRALEESYAAPLLFGESGDNEVSYTWAVDGIPCKARADRVLSSIDGKSVRLLDLKTAISASPDAFARATWQWGHHIRAAFYLDGWRQQPAQRKKPVEYIFIVVRKEPPHLISAFKLSTQAEAWGRKLYERALFLYAEAVKSGNWPAYSTAVGTIDLPVWAEHALADRDAAGQL